MSRSFCWLLKEHFNVPKAHSSKAWATFHKEFDWRAWQWLRCQNAGLEVDQTQDMLHSDLTCTYACECSKGKVNGTHYSSLGCTNQHEQAQLSSPHKHKRKTEVHRNLLQWGMTRRTRSSSWKGERTVRSKGRRTGRSKQRRKKRSKKRKNRIFDWTINSQSFHMCIWPIWRWCVCFFCSNLLDVVESYLLWCAKLSYGVEVTSYILFYCALTGSSCLAEEEGSWRPDLWLQSSFATMLANLKPN